MFREDFRDSRYRRIKRVETALSVLSDEVLRLQAQADSIIPDECFDFDFLYHSLSNVDKARYNTIWSNCELLKQSYDFLESVLFSINSSDD